MGRFIPSPLGLLVKECLHSKAVFQTPFYRTRDNFPKRKIGQNLGNTVIGRTAQISQKMKYFPWTSNTDTHTLSNYLEDY